MSDADPKSDLVNRVCHRMGHRYLRNHAGTIGWWTPILGPAQPDQTVAVRGPWPLQRCVLANFIAGLDAGDPATLRGPMALLDGIVEEAITIRADVSRERILRGTLANAEWARVATASGALDGSAFTLECVQHLVGVELQAGARWFFGMPAARANVEIDVVDDDAGIHLEILDGRQMPPASRRRRVRIGRRRALDICE